MKVLNLIRGLLVLVFSFTICMNFSVKTVYAGGCDPSGEYCWTDQWGRHCTDEGSNADLCCEITGADCWTCFPAGTGVLMSDGSQKNIEDVEVGEKVVSQSESGVKSISMVTELDQPIRNHMCQINYVNGESLKLTDEHPLYTDSGWKSIDPDNTYKDNPNLVVDRLMVGDQVIKADGSWQAVNAIDCWSERQRTYNLILDGGVNTYFADGYLAHNKDEGKCPAGEYWGYPAYCGERTWENCRGGCFPVGTKVIMEDGSEKDINEVKAGDKVVSQSEDGTKSISTVVALDQPVSGNMCEINYTDGESLRLTDNHPMFTGSKWKAINPQAALKENPSLPVSQLVSGDKIFKSDGTKAEVDYYSCSSQSIQTYNLILDGGVNTYFADGYLAHNKAGLRCWQEPYDPPVIRCWAGCIPLPQPTPSPSPSPDPEPITGTVYDDPTNSCVPDDPYNDSGIGMQVSLRDAGLSDLVNPGNGTYSIDAPIDTSYFIDLSSLPDGYICSDTCGNGCSISGVTAPSANNNFFITSNQGKWYQVVGGSLHADSGDVASSIPASCIGDCKPYLITEGAGGETGLVSFSGSVSVGGGSISEDATDWQAKTSYQGLVTDYNYFARLLEDDPDGIGVWDGSLPSGSGVFEGSITETGGGGWSVSDGDTKVLLTESDLVIRNNIVVAEGGFLAIISGGTISIADNVTQVQGVYIADEYINTCESASCGATVGAGDVSAAQLQAEGILVGWEGMNLRRDFESVDNNSYPAEVFTYRADLVTNAYRYLLKLDISWKEVAP